MAQRTVLLRGRLPQASAVRNRIAVTIGPRVGKRLPMRSFLLPIGRQLILAVLANASALAVNLEAEDAKRFSNLSDKEFQSLAQKTNLYVQALNAVSSIRSTYDRYASWVDVKKGPTGKERYITYGLYTLNSSPLNDMAAAATKGPPLSPPLPKLDDAAVKLAGAAKTLAPLVKAASEYYEQEDYKDDNAKRGQELHAQMMPLFEQVFAAEDALRRGLDSIKGEVDRRQLAEIEKQSGKNYEWHLRHFMINAKALVDLLPSTADAPMIDAAAYKSRYANLETAYNGFTQFVEERPEEVKKIILASFTETALKDFFAASKFLRRVLDAPKPDKREYVQKVNELVEKYNTLISRTNTFR
jgi:hypothetical protein